MRIGIIGSRNIAETEVVVGCMQQVMDPLEDECVPLTFLGGGSKGSERIAAEWVTSADYDYILFKPYNMVDTSVEHSPKFFFFRNKQIVDNSDAVIIFLDEEEHGVKRTLDYIKAKTSKPYVVFGPLGTIEEQRGDIKYERDGG